MVLIQNNYKFVVLNRKEAELYSKQVHRMRSVLISIYGSDEGPADIKGTSENNIKLVRFVRFDDIDKNQLGLRVFSPENAISILGAVEEAQFRFGVDGFDKIIVHCGAGISRSAGVAAALMYILTGSDKEIYNNPKYKCNSWVYRMMLKAYEVLSNGENLNLKKTDLNVDYYINFAISNMVSEKTLYIPVQKMDMRLALGVFCIILLYNVALDAYPSISDLKGYSFHIDYNGFNNYQSAIPVTDFGLFYIARERNRNLEEQLNISLPDIKSQMTPKPYFGGIVGNCLQSSIFGNTKMVEHIRKKFLPDLNSAGKPIKDSYKNNLYKPLELKSVTVPTVQTGYGWLSPEGVYYEVPFGKHPEYAYYILTNKKLLDSEPFNSMDFSEQLLMHEYALINSPIIDGGYHVTALGELTKKQMTFLYRFYMCKGLEKQAMMYKK